MKRTFTVWMPKGWEKASILDILDALFWNSSKSVHQLESEESKPAEKVLVTIESRGGKK